MKAMGSRAVASVLVLVLVGPAVVTATCELTCANHHSTPASSTASCHEHQGSAPDVAVSAASSSLCHASVDLPSAVVDAWLSAVVVTAVPAATVVTTPPLITSTIARAHERRAPFPPRPAPKPLRV
jgi:hypothetical protein